MAIGHLPLKPRDSASAAAPATTKPGRLGEVVARLDQQVLSDSSGQQVLAELREQGREALVDGEADGLLRRAVRRRGRSWCNAAR
ncbi:MAG: hypothetical protein R3E75_04985 [Steroidobacteraceae bacterium]